MQTQRPQILISNDDGIHAPGIRILAEVAHEFGDVTIVAPDSPQSAMGHAISIAKPLRLTKDTLSNGMIGYACNGTPADCVKLATGVLMKTTPDLVISGINHGTNTSTSTIYSGTLSAAREGALQDIPAVGFSLCHYDHEADMEACRAIARIILAKALGLPLSKGQVWNVNIPFLPLAEIKGIKWTHQAKGRWVEEFDERKDPYNKTYYWLTGKFYLLDESSECDEIAVKEGYVSVTPLMHDLTNYKILKKMEGIEF
ncbi:MAG: 5'/3'-nucleotidase SurE [Bacteroidia bacterium]